jgi:hypothetical protein
VIRASIGRSLARARDDIKAKVPRQRPGIISNNTPLKYSVSGIVGSTG